MIIGITTFDILPTNDIFNKVFKFDNNTQEPFNEYFEFMDIF
jgi:hypothetical protein